MTSIAGDSRRPSKRPANFRNAGANPMKQKE
jgi:hypothetical protein